MSKKKPRRVAMVGTAPSSEHAPINDKSWEIQGVGYRGEHMTRADRWFEIHRLDGLRDGPDWRPLLRKWAKDCELVMFWPEPLGPKVMQYPVERIKNRFGTYFMTSSFAWMLALAIDEHTNGKPIDEIGLWGVDMEYGTEYREQRAGVRHFIALAREVGIKTTMLVNGGLLYEPVPYPFWTDDPLMQKLAHRREGVENERADSRRVLGAGNARIGQINAAVKELEKIDGQPNTFTVSDYCQERIQKLKREAEGLAAKAPGMQESVSYCMGVLSEIDWQTDYLRP